MNPIVAGLDFETTGLLEPGHRIVEIGVAFYDLSTERRLAEWAQRVNPQRPIDPKAQAVHGISFEDVATCPTFDEVADKLIAVLTKADIIVAHNGLGFDIPFVTKELQRIGKPVPAMQVIDTMVQGRWATPFGKSPNLGELCFACRVPYDPAKAHGALYDVDVMCQAFFHARRKGFFQDPVSTT